MLSCILVLLYALSVQVLHVNAGKCKVYFCNRASWDGCCIYNVNMGACSGVKRWGPFDVGTYSYETGDIDNDRIQSVAIYGDSDCAVTVHNAYRLTGNEHTFYKCKALGGCSPCYPVDTSVYPQFWSKHCEVSKTKLDYLLDCQLCISSFKVFEYPYMSSLSDAPPYNAIDPVDVNVNSPISVGIASILLALVLLNLVACSMWCCCSRKRKVESKSKNTHHAEGDIDDIDDGALSDLLANASEQHDDVY